MNPINKERLAATFTRLCETDSPSWQEGKVADLLREVFDEFDCTIEEDETAPITGSDSGNLLVTFPGTIDTQPIFFNCHMDTVQPGIGVEVDRQEDIFTSKGDTVLGADDKSGLAALIEVMQLLRENNTPHGPIELLFTTCEEVGLLGAKSFDYSKLKSQTGYALDSTGIDRVIIGAPASNRIDIEVFGASAHAGLNPELSHPIVELTPKSVRDIHATGGTILGTSRGPQNPETIVDTLERMNIGLFFVIGGDGSFRGASAIHHEITKRGLKIGVIGIPKTIDNDIPLVDHTFGFHTSVSLAAQAIQAAYSEANSVENGIGLVKLMGRHAGFIAANTASFLNLLVPLIGIRR